MKKTQLPVRSRAAKTTRTARKVTPNRTRSYSKQTPMSGNILGVLALLVVLVGVAVALALSSRNQDTRQQAAFQVTQPNPETFCGLRVKDDFSTKHFLRRWSRDGSNVTKKNAVRREAGILKLDTLSPKKSARVSGIYQNKATDGKFNARVVLRRLQFAKKSQVDKEGEVPGYFALEQYHHFTPVNNGYNSLRIIPQPDGTMKASLASIENGKTIDEATASQVVPKDARNLRLQLQRKNGKLFGKVYNKAQNIDILVGPINAWEGSGSLSLHLYANPNNRLVASLDNYLTSYCVRSCNGLAQAEDFTGDLNDNWYLYNVNNDNVQNGKLKLQITPARFGFYSQFIKSKAVSRGAQASVISVDLNQTKLPGRSRLRFMLANEAQTKYSAVNVQRNEKGQLGMTSAFREYAKTMVSKNKQAIIPAGTEKLRLRISRQDDKVRISYKFDKEKWQKLSQYRYYIGPANIEINLTNTENKPLNEEAVVTFNTVRMGCSGTLPTPHPVIVPSPSPDVETGEIPNDPGLEDTIVGFDPIEIEEGGDEEYEEENQEDDWDDENWEDDEWEDDEWVDEEEDPEFADDEQP